MKFLILRNNGIIIDLNIGLQSVKDFTTKLKAWAMP